MKADVQKIPKCLTDNLKLIQSLWQEPEVFMTDNSAAEKGAWPNAKQLLCHFHVLQAEWDWLLKSKNGVEADQRKPLMNAFKKVSRV